jgi:microcystin-dependent protein
MMMKKITKSIGIVALAVALTAGMVWSPPAQAMEPFLGQIQMFGFNFPPRGWAFCDGQLLPISQNTALFSLLGTTYGGDGVSTFALPDLRGRVAIHPGNGPGLPSISQGEKSGNYQVALNVNHLPSHTHTATATVHASSEQGSQEGPGDNVLAYDRRETQYSASAPDVTMNAESATVTVGNTGGSQPFSIMQPYLGVYHCIALVGVYPSRQ